MVLVPYLRRPGWFRVLAFVLGFVLVDSLVVVLPATAAPGVHRPAPAHDKSVPGVPAATRPVAPDPVEQKAVHQAPSATVWPGAGSATVDVPRSAAETGAAAGAAPRSAAPARAKAGSLPVSVGPAAAGGTAAAAGQASSVEDAAAAPARVRVDLLGRRGDGLLLRVNRADGGNRAGRVSLEVDYSAFRDTFGGDWATRLRLVSLPECAASTPDRPDCRGVSVPTANNGSGRLTGDVSVGVSGTSAGSAAGSGLFAVLASSSGGAGDFGASSMSPSATWQAGGPSGDFTWNYPMAIPPALGGPTPELALTYNSGNVDGRTSGTNNQPSWVGEGMDLSPGGYVERRYTPCASDMKTVNGQKPNNTTKTGDLCWGNDNLYFSLNGAGGELVRDDATGTWHPRVDDGSKVEQLYDASLGNGARNGEYWRITNRQGVQYYFGLNKLPGWTSPNLQTQSVWTVPVFGNHPGEPCHGSTFDASSCPQGWRWNLDYVVDPHKNTMSFFYQQEKNNYARNLTASKVSSYVRGGWLEHIEYGQRDREVYTTPFVGRVLFQAADRCIPGTTCDTAHPGNWPDVPWDQSCTSSTSCKDKYSPTFWTQKRLSWLKTQVWGGSGPRDVNQWNFTPQYPDPGDGTKPRLWLNSVQQTGLVNGSATLPPVTFEGQQLPNRVDGTDHIPAMNWWRMKAIRGESGDEIRVTYSPQECNYLTKLPAPDTNGLRCYPLRWTPDGLSEQTDWFNKYVVTQVTESDRTTGFEPEVSDVEYVGPAAWRHDEEDGLVPEDRKTWSQWRGYAQVRVRKGRADQPRSMTEMRYFRGMDGDATATAGVAKHVQVVDSTNTPWPDTDQLAGMPRETTTYTGNDGTILSRTITDPWLSTATATRVRSWGTTSAYQVQQQKITQGETENGQWRQTATVHTYDPDGTLLREYDQGDLADAKDDTCTTYTYARNTSAWILDAPAERRTTVGDCARQPTGAPDVISDERLYYDGSDTLGAAPVLGDVTRRDQFKGWSNGAPTFLTALRSRYDGYGRLIEARDVYDRPQTFTYTPASGPTTRTTTLNQLGQQATTDVDPAWGTATETTTVSGARTDVEYDPLGRVVKTWAPGRDHGQSPTNKYQYLLRSDGPNVLTTSTLEADGGYRTEYQLLDGKLRVRQTQDPSPAGGRVVTDIVYDSQGRKVKENGPYHNDAPPGTDLLLPQEDLLPAQTTTLYDDAGRVTNEIFSSLGLEKWRTTYVHHLDRQDTIPPKGDTPTTRFVDAQGRLAELRQYKGDTASGPYDSTSYAYTPRGELSTITDPAGNTWRFSYDARGNRSRVEDPDQGTTTSTFGDSDELLTTTDARGTTLAFEYDALGRKTVEHQDSVTGPKLAEWTYDKLPDGTAVPGLPATTTRYVNGERYTTAVTKYDTVGRPTEQTVTIPDKEGKLAGTYTFGRSYAIDGEVATSKLPALGGLPEETLTFGVNSLGMATTLTGATSYVTGTGYTEYGEQNQLTLSAGGKKVYRDFSYETGSRRLTEATTRRENGAALVSDVSYRYDDAGNLRRISDAPDPATGSGTDTQCFDYDYLRRLTQAWTPGNGDCGTAPTAAALGGAAPYWHAWTFDATGNRKTETRTSPGGSTTTSTYSYNAAGGAQPHALRGVTTTGPGGTTSNGYDYDPAGDLTTRTRAGVGQTFEWDAEGHVSTVTENGKTTSYLYDADGNRLISDDPDGAATLYLGDSELHVDSGGGRVGTRYYQHNGQTIAMRNGLDGRLTWLVSDQHGTAEIAVAEDTQAIQRQRHDPYGNTRGTETAPVAGDRGFVGGVTDATTGLTHLGARDYDATTGRFISVDPEIDYEDPQQMNGFAYANNSPVTFTDPDGTAYVTRTVTTWKTVYHTVIRKVVEAIQVLVTVIVFWFLMMISAPWHVYSYYVTKLIVRYIKEVVKRIVKITRLIRVFVRTHDSRTAKHLRSLAGQLDRLNQIGLSLARSAASVMMMAKAIADQQQKQQDRDKGKPWYKRLSDKIHSVVQNKWFQWAAVAAGVVGLFACPVCGLIGFVGVAMSTASTADSCSHRQWSSCGIGVASMGLGMGGEATEVSGARMVLRGRMTLDETRWLVNPIRRLGGYGRTYVGRGIERVGRFTQYGAAGLDVYGAM
ncbi:RHS repeat-associated core domain-containing protein [Micromonospora sp. NPDC023966]|uniref:RHS repeat domain-containing protein n=1 Tax=Micromonospora sp. NPDC023966 TaxID=3154699 RepID=UPI0033D163CC